MHKKDIRQLRFPYDAQQSYPFLLRDSQPPAVFIHIPKTGGTSIVKALNLPKIDEAKGLKKHYRGLFIQAHLPDSLWQEAFKFAFVRNPHERLYSHYRFRLSRGIIARKRTEVLPFNDWVLKELSGDRPGNLRPQYQWVHDEQGELLVDFLGRFTHLAEDFAHIAQQLGMVDATLPHLNKGGESIDYRSAYNKEAWDFAEDFYQQDFALLKD